MDYQPLSMTDQVSSLGKSLYFEIRRVNQIRIYLSLDVTVTLMVSLVLSKLNYGNALLSGLSLDQLYKVQKVENHATEVIFKKEKNDHAATEVTALVTCERKNRL